jgi:hypothetical protein
MRIGTGYVAAGKIPDEGEIDGAASEALGTGPEEEGAPDATGSGGDELVGSRTVGRYELPGF